MNDDMYIMAQFNVPAIELLQRYRWILLKVVQHINTSSKSDEQKLQDIKVIIEKDCQLWETNFVDCFFESLKSDHTRKILKKIDKEREKNNENNMEI